MAADLVVETLSQVDALEPGMEQRQLVDLAIRLDQIVADAQQGDPRLGGMGSTMVLVWLNKSCAFWVHVGDSRLYLLRDQSLHQITRDQSLARFLVGEGEITLKQAENHYSTEVMNQCLGCGYCEPETNSLKLTQGDILLLSTDGLHRSITAKQLEDLLNTTSCITNAAQVLVKSALGAGGTDNITCVIIQA